MAVSVTHTYVSPITDLLEAGKVGPDEWNDTHVVTGLAAVATSGAAADITGLAAVATSGAASDISGLGTAATKNTGTSGSTIPLLNVANTWSATQTINDPTAGYVITNSGSSATLAADYAYNRSTVSNDAIVGSVSFSTINQYSILQILTNTAKGQKIAIRGLVNQSASGITTGGDAIGTSGWAISNSTNGGTDTGSGAAGTLFGGEFIAHAFDGALNYGAVVGAEFDAIVSTGASAKHRWGISLSGNGDIRGASTDAAIEIGAAASAGSWNTGILYSNVHGFAPVPTTGTLIGSDGSSVTATNFISLPTYTFTGNIFDFGSGVFKVSGAGNITSFAGQIAFPATQNASSDVNTLDDYEEGTWTPVFTAETTPPTSVTYTIQTGTYVKVGKLVHAQFTIVLSSKGSGGVGNINITGLPFTPGVSSSVGGVVSNVDLDAGYSYTNISTSTLNLLRVLEFGDNIATGTIPWANATDTSIFQSSFVYTV